MSEMGKFALEQQEREKARTASVYEAEIIALNEEINKLKERLKVIEDSGMIIRNSQTYPDFSDNTDSTFLNPKGKDTITTRVIAGNTITVSRPKENEDYVPLSFYVAIDERDNLKDGDLIYEANGDV
jgi:hypothetical protein